VILAKRFQIGCRNPHVPRSCFRGAARFRRDGITACAPRSSTSSRSRSPRQASFSAPAAFRRASAIMPVDERALKAELLGQSAENAFETY